MPEAEGISEDRKSVDLSTSPEMPDLETIIREFEKGYLSPKKSEEAGKPRNFVRKIVAAFEVKYKAYESMQEARENQLRKQSMERDIHQDSKSPKKKSLFGTPFKTQNREKKTDDSIEEESTSEFSTPTKSPKSIGLFSSPFNGHSASKDPNRRSGVYMTPVDAVRQDSGAVDLGSFYDASSASKYGKDCSRIANSSGYFSTPLDDTKSFGTMDFESTFPEPEETLLIKTSTTLKLDAAQEEQRKDKEDTTPMDRTPKVVGAFLKKPIEYQDTSINWIPITGKKLPRKKSLKKIFSLFSNKNALVKSKLYSSEKNLSEEPKELQDSGYDERSTSSSLASLTSFNEMLLQQKNTYVEPHRRGTFQTFHPKKNTGIPDKEAIYENAQSIPKKMILTEVPRKDIKADLGPSYPSTSKLTTMSLDRKSPVKKLTPEKHVTKESSESPSPTYVTVSRIPKHPGLSKIPKHPFVSMTKMDQIEETDTTVTIRNGLYEVEFHRSCEDFSRQSSSSEGSSYDVPRRFISKSVTEISGAGRSSRSESKEEHMYDVPRSHSLTRPRSSLYEDAVSLRRRADFIRGDSTPDFYATEDEPHYATVKPRSRKVYLNPGVLGSTLDLGDVIETSSV